eukprot:9592767-Alexandrium_andersonii.AAC.1
MLSQRAEEIARRAPSALEGLPGHPKKPALRLPRPCGARPGNGHADARSDSAWHLAGGSGLGGGGEPLAPRGAP